MNIVKQNNLAVIAITPEGVNQAKCLREHYSFDGYTTEKLATEGFKSFDDTMAVSVRKIFPQYESLLFICATGIVIRMIAPMVRDKFSDPAVLVMDEQAEFVISLLSGHVGGANKIAREIAKVMNATPVITTATDVNQVASLDLIIKALGANLEKHREAIKTINQMLVSHKKVGLYTEYPYPIDRKGFYEIASLKTIPSDLDALVIISPYLSAHYHANYPVIKVIPKQTILGIGCKRDTESSLIKTLLEAYCAQNDIEIESLSEMGSVDIKADEKCILEVSEMLNVPFKTFSVNELKQYEDRFESSEFVKKTIGVGSVSQPSAWILSNGNLIGETIKKSGVTLTLGMKEDFKCYM